MESYSAWHALINTDNFIWYMVLALLLFGMTFPRITKGIAEILGNDHDEIMAKIKKSSEQCGADENNDYFAQWKVDLSGIIMDLKHDRSWAVNKTDEKLMLAAVTKILSRVSFLDKDNMGISTISELDLYFRTDKRFKEVSGAEAQSVSSRSQLAFAIVLPDDAGRNGIVALVIPGNIYPGTAFGNDNPMVLFFSEDAVMELQAAAAFNPANKPRYYAVRNMEC